MRRREGDGNDWLMKIRPLSAQNTQALAGWSGQSGWILGTKRAPAQRRVEKGEQPAGAGGGAAAGGPPILYIRKGGENVRGFWVYLR